MQVRFSLQMLGKYNYILPKHRRGLMPSVFDDNEQKKYRLRISTQNPLTGGAYQIIDNQAFDFQIKTADITSLVWPVPSSPQIACGTDRASGAGVNTVDVSATQITPTAPLAVENPCRCIGADEPEYHPRGGQ